MSTHDRGSRLFICRPPAAGAEIEITYTPSIELLTRRTRRRTGVPRALFLVSPGVALVLYGIQHVPGLRYLVPPLI